MAQRTCSIAGCDGAHIARGWCSPHYHAWKRYGHPLSAPGAASPFGPKAATLAEALQRRYVVADDGCWNWIAGSVPSGYGYLTWDDHSQPAHRWSWINRHGPIPAGLEIDHLCRNRGCVNPDHLEPVTHVENVRRSRKALNPDPRQVESSQ